MWKEGCWEVLSACREQGLVTGYCRGWLDRSSSGNDHSQKQAIQKSRAIQGQLRLEARKDMGKIYLKICLKICLKTETSPNFHRINK